MSLATLSAHHESVENGLPETHTLTTEWVERYSPPGSAAEILSDRKSTSNADLDLMPNDQILGGPSTEYFDVRDNEHNTTVSKDQALWLSDGFSVGQDYSEPNSEYSTTDELDPWAQALYDSRSSNEHNRNSSTGFGASLERKEEESWGPYENILPLDPLIGLEKDDNRNLLSSEEFVPSTAVVDKVEERQPRQRDIVPNTAMLDRLEEQQQQQRDFDELIKGRRSISPSTGIPDYSGDRSPSPSWATHDADAVPNVALSRSSTPDTFCFLYLDGTTTQNTRPWTKSELMDLVGEICEQSHPSLVVLRRMMKGVGEKEPNWNEITLPSRHSLEECLAVWNMFKSDPVFDLCTPNPVFWSHVNYLRLISKLVRSMVGLRGSVVIALSDSRHVNDDSFRHIKSSLPTGRSLEEAELAWWSLKGAVSQATGFRPSRNTIEYRGGYTLSAESGPEGKVLEWESRS